MFIGHGIRIPNGLQAGIAAFRNIINLLFATSTRNSPMTGFVDGVLTTFAANTPSFNEGELQNYDAATNHVLQSNNPNITWIQRGAFSAVQDLVGADGVANTGWTLGGMTTIGGNLDDMFQVVSGLTPSIRYEPSILLKQISTSGIMQIGDPQTGGGVNWEIDLSKLNADWAVVDRNHPAVTIVVEFTSESGGISGLWFQKKSGGTLSVGFSGAQFELGAISTPYIETTTTAVTRAADVTTVPTPSVLTSESGAIEMVVTPAAAGQMIKWLFSIYDSIDDYIGVKTSATGAELVLEKRVAGGVITQVFFAYPHVAGTALRFQAYYDNVLGLGIRAADASADITAETFITDVDTDLLLIDPLFSVGNRADVAQFVGDYDNDGVPVCYSSKEAAGW